MADTKITDLTEKATGAATDEFVINDVAGGNADKKLGMDGIRITESQITNLGTYLTDITGEASTDLTDTANLAYLDTDNTFTGIQYIVGDGSSKILATERYSDSTASANIVFRKARGSLASPTVPLTGDIINEYVAAVWDGVAAWRSSAGMRFISEGGTVSPTSSPGRLDLMTTPIGSTTYLTRMRINSEGQFDFVQNEITGFVFDANNTNNAITNIDVADLANGTDGEIITWDAAGAPTTVAVGTASHVLTSNGAGAAPTFQAGGTGDVILASAQTHTGIKTYQGSNTGDVVADEYDIILGGTGVGEGGAMKFGAAELGFEVSTHLVTSLELGGAIILANSGTPIGKSEFIFADSTGAVRFGIPKAAAGDGTYSPRSMIIAGPATLNDNIYTGTTWGFDQLAMDTAVSGADLGVQNDIQVLGRHIVGETIYMKERAADLADISTYGQLWVESTATQKLNFTDEAGTTTNLLTGGGDTVIGTQVIEIDASALYPGGATPAAGLVTKQFGANSQPIRAIQLSDSENQEVYAQFKWNNWGTKTIKVKAYWFVENDIATPESKTFELDCSGVSLGNFDNIGGTAYGTLQTITDTTDSTAAEDKINLSPASASITIAGSPAEGDWVSLKMVRDAATDTAGNVFLAGITIEYSIAAGTATI